MTVQEIYNSLNDSEKFGLKFGLFPITIEDQIKDGKEIIVELMKLSSEDTGKL